jgi:geranylgeranyl pyrophosphate synthase
MVLHALKHSAKAKRLIEILNSHPSDEKTIHEAISIMQDAGSIDYAKKRAVEIVRDSWKEAEKTLPDTEGKKKLKALADYLIEREV